MERNSSRIIVARALGGVTGRDRVLVELHAIERQRASVRQRDQEGPLVAVEHACFREGEAEHAEQLASRNERQKHQAAPAGVGEHRGDLGIEGSEPTHVLQPQRAARARDIADRQPSVDRVSLSPAHDLGTGGRGANRGEARFDVAGRPSRLARHLERAPALDRPRQRRCAPTGRLHAGGEDHSGDRADVEGSPEQSGDRLESRQLFGRALAFPLQTSHLGDVADERDDEPTVGALLRTEADLRGEFRPVLAQAEHGGGRGAHGPHARGGDIARLKGAMLAAESLGHEIVEGSADELLAGVAEELRRLRVHVDEAPIAVHDEDAVGR
jgi:hypothetical protein